LLAKIIVTAPSWEIVVQKASRALEDTSIDGVKTNLNILRGIVAHPAFAAGDCDTQWLEKNQVELLKLGDRLSESAKPPEGVEPLPTAAVGALAAPLFRKGDAWTVNLTPLGSSPSAAGATAAGPSSSNHFQISRVLRNDFPTSLAAEITFTTASTSTPYKLSLSQSSATASAATAQHRRGDPSNPNHIVFPFPGKLIEVLVDEGDVIKAEAVVAIVRQMKMEIEIRARRGGRVVWVTRVEDGEDVNEGVLAAVVDGGEEDGKGVAKL
jgi:acetyl/propionyl-CoA carboxylase alpha subunit